MNEFDRSTIEDMLRGLCGEAAKFQIYDRSFKSPMNYVLNMAEKAIASKFMVYWVEGGLPENFCLSGFEDKPVVFNTRYLEMTGLIRSIVTADSSSDNIIIELSEQICLRLMAEFSLRDGVADIAAFLMQKSVQGQKFFLSDKNRLRQIEAEPLSERYMVFWFFGLLHELGHFCPEISEAVQLSQGHTLSDKNIISLVSSALELFPYTDDLKNQAMHSVTDADSVLAVHQLREEALADMFAAQVLLYATRGILKESKIKFDLVDFIFELGLFVNIMCIINCCKRVARTARPENMKRSAIEAMAFHPVAIALRLTLLRDFLARFLPVSWGGAEIVTQSNIDEWSKHITKIFKGPQPRFDLVEKGLANAMRYVFFPNERDSGIGMKLFNELANTNNPARIILKDFLILAESLNVVSPFLLAIQLMVDDDLRQKGHIAVIEG